MQQEFKISSELETEFKDADVVIVNLSAVVPWKTGPGGYQTAGFAAFAELCNRYSAPKSRCCRPGSALFTLSNYTWVAVQYSLNLNSVINPYKSGQIDTPVFLGKMLRLFSFLRTADFPMALKTELWREKNKYLSLREMVKEAKDLSSEEIALALLERAWNAPVDFTAEAKQRLAAIIGLAQAGKKIILVSNTNELNAHAILGFIQAEYLTEFAENKALITTAAEQGSLLRRISPNIFVSFSYLAKQFKVSTSLAAAFDNNVLSTTPGLMTVLWRSLLKETRSVVLVSQHPADIVQGKKFGWVAISARDFFSLPASLAVAMR